MPFNALEPFGTEPPRPTPATSHTAGWYPDPTHRFEFRYYNGERWTADVARQSVRYIDPIGTAPATFNAPPSRALAVTALVFALCSIAIAWLPFLFVVGAAGAITALILGMIVMRRSARNKSSAQPVPIGQGMAISAICVAVAALGLCVVGFQLTRVVLREVNELVNPGPHEVVIDHCASDGLVTAEGTILNRDAEVHDYTITIAFHLNGKPYQTDVVAVFDVAPGERAPFSTASDSVTFTSGSLTCSVASVYGPTPFSN